MEEQANYKRIEKAIKYIIDNFRKQPSLEELAGVVGISSYHFQRLFTEWAGVSPKQFLSYLTVEALKKEIVNSQNLIDASERVGLSAQSRAYDLMVHIEAVTPGEYKTFGKGLQITYGFSETPFGQCFVATTSRGVCSFQFADDNKEEIIASHYEEWPFAHHMQSNKVAENIVRSIFTNAKQPLSLCLKGTPFQIKVWSALLSIPFGSVFTYSELAQLINKENAVRAVASAVAKNPIGLIIPCHRIIRNEGIIGQYHWKSERKASIIGWEKARIQTPETN